MSASRALMLPFVLAGCGPTVAEALDEGTTAAALTTSSTDTSFESSDTSSESSGEESSTGEMWIVPPEHVIAIGECSEGFATLFVEAYLLDDPFGSDLDPTPDNCVPASDIALDEALLVFLSRWDGLPGTFEVQPAGPTFVGHAGEPLSGLATLEAWAPYHPTVLHLNVSGSTGNFVGSLQIEPCGVVVDAPCDR